MSRLRKLLRSPFYWLLFMVPSLPLLLFILPQSVTLMPESTGRWYTPYTTPLSLATAIYVSPATAANVFLELQPESWGWWAVVLLYTFLIGGALCRVVSRRNRELTTPTTQHG